MFYKNVSYTAKTFYGVTFGPGEIKQVDGIINNKWMVIADGPATKVTQVTQQKPSSDEPKEADPVPEKVEEVVESKEEQPVEDPKKEEKSSGKGKKS